MKILLVGAGKHAIEYAKVLMAMQIRFTPVTRSQESASIFHAATGIIPVTGGIEKYIRQSKDYTAAIVSVNYHYLTEISILLIQSGIKKILIEKPGGLVREDMAQLATVSDLNRAKAYVAYNRRFYASIAAARTIIETNQGPISFSFDFTEWTDKIDFHDMDQSTLKYWVIANSSHVLDLAFHLCGRPSSLSSITYGSLPWHESACIFAGSGVTEKSAVFSYHANWSSTSRWMIQIYTGSVRILLSPLEKIQLFDRQGDVALDQVVDYSLDEQFKPGLYKQVKAFMEEETQFLCTVGEQMKMMDIYCRIAGYKR